MKQRKRPAAKIGVHSGMILNARLPSETVSWMVNTGMPKKLRASPRVVAVCSLKGSLNESGSTWMSAYSPTQERIKAAAKRKRSDWIMLDRVTLSGDPFLGQARLLLSWRSAFHDDHGVKMALNLFLRLKARPSPKAATTKPDGPALWGQ